MSNNPIAGKCLCPICLSPEAEVLHSSEGKGKPYVKCDECVSICRTSSALGARRMLERIRGKASPPPAIEADKAPNERSPADPPPPPVPPKKKAGWLDAIKDA